jgi:hypothetical protein
MLSKLTAQPRCGRCDQREVHCTVCGRFRDIRSGTTDAPVCGPCTKPDAELWRPCPTCGEAERLTVPGPCRRCTLKQRLDDLLADDTGTIPPKLQALHDTLAGTERTATAMSWLEGCRLHRPVRPGLWPTSPGPRGPGRPLRQQGRRAHPQCPRGRRSAAAPRRADGPPRTAREGPRRLARHPRGTADPAPLRDLAPDSPASPPKPRQRHHAHPAQRRTRPPSGRRLSPGLAHGPGPDLGQLPAASRATSNAG